MNYFLILFYFSNRCFQIPVCTPGIHCSHTHPQSSSLYTCTSLWEFALQACMGQSGIPALSVSGAAFSQGSWGQGWKIKFPFSYPFRQIWDKYHINSQRSPVTHELPIALTCSLTGSLFYLYHVCMCHLGSQEADVDLRVQAVSWRQCLYKETEGKRHMGAGEGLYLVDMTPVKGKGHQDQAGRALAVVQSEEVSVNL